MASHGYAHELIESQTAESFREDVRWAKRILEDVTGEWVRGYRAPSFSISPETEWALPILVEEGYLYDSSIFPIIHDRYGWPGAKPTRHQLHTEAGTLWEVPPSTVKVAGMRIPIAGGGYLRLLPLWLLRRLMARVVDKGEQLVMYLHPWELDPEQPRMNGSFWSTFRHYINLDKTESRFDGLLKEFSFRSISEAIPELQEAQAYPEIPMQRQPRHLTSSGRHEAFRPTPSRRSLRVPGEDSGTIVDTSK